MSNTQTNRFLLMHAIGLLCALSVHAADVTAISVSQSASTGVKDVLTKAWPKALKACPGLSKYATDLAFAGVEDNYAYAPKTAQRIEVKFMVAENPSRIPGDFRAAGHTCYFSIAPDGSKLTISKSSCAALCVDGTPPKGDLVKPL